MAAEMIIVDGREVAAAAYRKVAKCAETGAKLLDKKRPDWFKRIRTTKLQMTSSCSCIYGQLQAEDLISEIKLVRGYKPYAGGVSVSAHFGYWPPESVDYELGGTAWKILQEEWLRQIRDRRQAAKAQVAS